ncbi:MAG: Gfo/Idh/MocA family protein [Terriglobales bacterium]
MAEKRTLNIAMIGQGFMGRAHSNAFHQVNHFFDTGCNIGLKVICGRDRQRLAEMASQWQWEETATDWQAMVSRPDIDVVDVAVPNVLHAPIAIAAAQAGKIVLCEKPLATSLDEAERMAQAARNVPNLVWFNYRRVPAIAFIKQLISDGKLGQIFHYRANYMNQSGNTSSQSTAWRYRREEAGSGALGDLLSHVIDLSIYLNGPIAELNSMLHTFVPGRDVDDAVATLVRFANGSVGAFEASRYGVGCRNRNTFEIQGSKGRLSFNLEDMNHIEFYDATLPGNLQGNSKILVTGPGHPYEQNFWKPGHGIGYEHTFIATFGDFLTSLSRKESFHPNFDDGLLVQRVLDAVEKSARSRSWVKLN